MAAYKHYDVLLVNAMFDGMNLVAKEGPIVNEHEGVSILSENTGAHEELGEYALSVNPFDIQELANSIYAALTMDPRERRRRAQGLAQIVTSRDPGDWIDEQLADIRAKGAARLNGASRTATLLRLSDMTLPAPTYDLVLLLDPQAEESDAREDRRRHARRDRGAGRAAAPRRVGRAGADATRSPRKTSAEYHLLQFHAGNERAARRPRPHAADHRRRAALPHHQARRRACPDAPDMRSSSAPPTRRRRDRRRRRRRTQSRPRSRSASRRSRLALDALARRLCAWRRGVIRSAP